MKISNLRKIKDWQFFKYTYPYPTNEVTEGKAEEVHVRLPNPARAIIYTLMLSGPKLEDGEIGAEQFSADIFPLEEDERFDTIDDASELRLVIKDLKAAFKIMN